MRRRVFIEGLLFSLVGAPALAADPPPALLETSMFADQVKAGTLPPIAARIPEQPYVVKTFPGGDGPGQPGGDLNMLVASPRDTSLMTVYSYTRLIVYDDRFKLRSDILESYDEKEGRSFTLRLRAGHKWSDGHPFTTEDFRFYWEDVANNAELSPSGPPIELLVDGQPPKVEILDQRSIRYSWDRPNPYFVESQARAAPLWLFRPAHYLKRFHARFTDPAQIAAEAKAGPLSGSWVQTFRRVDVMFNNDNVDLPTLNPWVLTTPPPGQRFVFLRNPYYHRIDERGRQLPYVDRVIFTVSAPNLIPAKAGLGEADLQSRYLNLRDYAFLRNAAKSSGADVRLWELGSGSQLALYPNLNANDRQWRTLFRDVRFRRALSVAIDREELNQVVFLGLGTPSNNTVMPQSVLFKREYATRWAQLDSKLADKLLDEIGLVKRDSTGVRLLPDGRSAILVVESQSEQTEDTDTLQLISDYFRAIGIRMLVKPQTRENFRLRTFSGEAVMTAFAGVVTAAATPNTSPREFAPTMRGGLQWPKWGMYVESNGKQGEKCDLESACRLLDYVDEWQNATDEAGHRAAWEKILQTNADQVFSIGTVNGVRQPVVVGAKVRNVPKEGYYAWDPGGYIGLYQPDTFWVAS
ncbi:MAG: ABC transporter substrate-binding protein [Alphaproteobacteria bacterium]|nr:ABC transporter substrate-binding protein [Alphaproteobacteria bacterium]